MIAIEAPGRRADALRGAGAAIALAVLLFGVPWLLLALVGWPLPRELPALSEITGSLRDSYVPDSFLVKAMAVVCWVVWFELAASAVVEALAVVQDRRAGRVPLAGPLQRLVGHLVAAVALLFLLAATRGQQPAVVEPLPAAPVIDLAGMEQPAGKVTAAPLVKAELPTYKVQRRDTLWGIAESHLRDPFRWTEIWELNRGRPQDDGRTFVDPDRIYPGWRLALPADAVGLATPVSNPAPAGSGPDVMTVVDGGPGTMLVRAPAGEPMVQLADGGDGMTDPGD